MVQVLVFKHAQSLTHQYTHKCDHEMATSYQSGKMKAYLISEQDFVDEHDRHRGDEVEGHHWNYRGLGFGIHYGLEEILEGPGRERGGEKERERGHNCFCYLRLY